MTEIINEEVQPIEGRKEEELTIETVTNNISEITEAKVSITNYVHYIETKAIAKLNPNALNEAYKLQVGDVIKMGYIIPEGDKERTQYYEGLIISISNRGLGKTFTLRRSVQNVGVEQVFLMHSPKIVSLVKKQSSKVRRAKLYFIRNLRGKSTRLKVRFSSKT